MSDLTPDDCLFVAEHFGMWADELPLATKPLRTKLATLAREYRNAAKYFERALEEGHEPEIRYVGSLEPGEYIRLASREHRVRRVTETGIEIMADGKWSWENVSSRTTPVCVVETPGYDRG